MKHEWRKAEKEIYIPKNKPELKEIPCFKFICIDGTGDPNNDDFKKRIEALYPIAYAIKMMPKKGIEIEGYFDYTVYPLEGTWDLTEKGRKQENLNKDELVYTIMIRQPEFVTDEIFSNAIKSVKDKKNIELLDEVYFKTLEDGLSVQMMHIGPFEEESKSFDCMIKFCEENSLSIKSKVHREIYLSDFRRTEESKLKTVLRYRVSKEDSI